MRGLISSKPGTYFLRLPLHVSWIFWSPSLWMNCWEIKQGNAERGRGLISRRGGRVKAEERLDGGLQAMQHPLSQLSSSFVNRGDVRMSSRGPYEKSAEFVWEQDVIYSTNRSVINWYFLIQCHPMLTCQQKFSSKFQCYPIVKDPSI